ncbi:MAG: transposase, partial [Tannerella sp.]|nr:transposase [Tannerella sp.]
MSDTTEREKVHLEQIHRQSEQIHRQSEQIHQLSGQITHQTGQIEELSLLLKEQTKTIQSLEESLLQKGKDLTSLSGRNRGLTKLLNGNVSEKITPETPRETEDTVEKKKTPSPKERGNNQARRKEHFDLEEEIIEIWPDHAGFDTSKVHIVGQTDSIRYSYIPCKFKKTIYRQYNCKAGDTILCGVAPRAPFMNSNYDASFIAGMMQQRYMYAMPVYRIVNLFNECGFELNRATAHGLIAKASARLDEFYEVLRRAIHEDAYIRMDETYHNVLTGEKNAKGKGIRKGFFWSAMADTFGLVHFFYEEGSREKNIFLDYLDKSYQGAVHTDGYSCYKRIETDEYPYARRISCIQHAKRKFIDIGKDDQAGEIICLINQLYQIEHNIPPAWTPKQKLRERNKKAPPILKSIRKKLLAIKNDPQTLPSTPLA